MKFGKFFLFLFFGFTLFFALPKKVSAAYVRVPILMYHYIRNVTPLDKASLSLSVSPSSFDGQMNYLAQNGYTPISLDELYAIYNNISSAPAKPVVITFDDGYGDLYWNAYSILKKYNFKAISFLITNLVDKPGYVSWNNVNEMKSLIIFESHTLNHAYLPRYDFTTVYNELKQSKEIIESHSGYPVQFISYPFGASNGIVQSQAAKAGYAGGLGTWSGKASAVSMNLPRVRINYWDNLQTFASKL